MDAEEYEALWLTVTESFSSPALAPFHLLAMDRIDTPSEPRERVLAYLEAMTQVFGRFDNQRYKRTVDSINECLSREREENRLNGALLIFNDPESAGVDFQTKNFETLVFSTEEIVRNLKSLIAEIRNDLGPDRDGPPPGRRSSGPQR